MIQYFAPMLRACVYVRTLSVIIVKNRMCQYCSLLSIAEQKLDELRTFNDDDNRVLMYRYI